jgi:hypothetical protein
MNKGKVALLLELRSRHAHYVHQMRRQVAGSSLAPRILFSLREDCEQIEAAVTSAGFLGLATQLAGIAHRAHMAKLDEISDAEDRQAGADRLMDVLFPDWRED